MFDKRLRTHQALRLWQFFIFSIGEQEVFFEG